MEDVEQSGTLKEILTEIKKLKSQSNDDIAVAENSKMSEPEIAGDNGGEPDDDEAAKLSLIQSTSKRASILAPNAAQLDLTELQSTSRYYRGQTNENISSPVWSSPNSTPESSSSSSSHVITVEDNRPERFLGKRPTGQTAPLSTAAAAVVANVLEIERINLEDDEDPDDDDDLDDDDEDEGIRRLNPPQNSSANNIDYLLSLLPPTDLNDVPFEDPIQIRGNGNMTLFGLSNCYSSTFPSALLGRVSKEEFQYTINRINNLLRQQHSTNAKFLLLGCLCCCFSLGCSLLWPTFALSKRTRNSLEKLLSMENSRLYNKLGLNWRLAKEPSHTNHSFMEYILVIDFIPKMHIYQPD